MIRVVHTADNHLDPKLGFMGAKAQERRRDFYNSFLKVVEFSLEAKPHMLLISGDLFDSINPRNPIRTRVLQAFRKLSSEGIRIFAIGGNHDMPRSQEEGMSPLSELEAAGYVTFFSELNQFSVEHVSVEGYDVAVAGLSYDHTLETSSNPLRYYNLKIPLEGDVNIAMLHYNFAGFNIPRSWAAPTITPEDVPEGLDYLALGHLHAHSYTIVKNAYVVYPGSTERRSFNEELDERKGFVYAEINPSRGVVLRFNEVPTRRLRTIEVHVDENVENPTAHILASVPPPDPQMILRIVVSGRLTLERLSKYSRAEILKRLSDRFFHTVIDDSELKCVIKEIRVSLDTSSPIESYKRYIEEAMKNASADELNVWKRALSVGLQALEEVGAW